MNFEDPEILKLMVGKKMKKNWKETYGFDFVSYGGDKSEVSFSKKNLNWSIFCSIR